MECPHCGKVIHPVLQKDVKLPYGDSVDLDNDIEDPIGRCEGDILSIYVCPQCKNRIIKRVSAEYDEVYDEWFFNDENIEIIYPLFSELTVNSRVPPLYANELKKANAIINISSDASAMLSRRILQLIINKEYNIKNENLKNDIEVFLKTSELPDYLIKSLSHIRSYGNLAAHGSSWLLKNINSVKKDEAKYLIETLKDLFNYAFIYPRRTQKHEKRLHGEDNNEDEPPF